MHQEVVHLYGQQCALKCMIDTVWVDIDTPQRLQEAIQQAKTKMPAKYVLGSFSIASQAPACSATLPVCPAAPVPACVHPCPPELALPHNTTSLAAACHQAAAAATAPSRTHHRTIARTIARTIVSTID